MKPLDPVKIKSEIYTIKAKLILKFQWLCLQFFYNERYWTENI